MNTFNSLYRLTEVIKAAETHCSFFRSSVLCGKYYAMMLPVVLIHYKHALNIPAYESIPEITVNWVGYVQKYLTVFGYGRELCGEEGKGEYGIGMYEERAGGSWHCDSILFDEESHEPLLVKGRDTALKVAAEEVRIRNKSNARDNENAILEHGLIEAPTLNAILVELMRAKPGTAPATIGMRARRIQLLLEGDDEDGRCLAIPGAGFVCRDEAAGTILQQIAYVTDTARRTRRHELMSEGLTGFAFA